MTEKEIVRLAEEAELWLHSDRKYEAVKKFAALVAASERERILDMCKEGLWDGEGIRAHLEKRELTSLQRQLIDAGTLESDPAGLKRMNKEAEKNGEEL